jgi:hypothetical protein
MHTIKKSVSVINEMAVVVRISPISLQCLHYLYSFTFYKYLIEPQFMTKNDYP